MQQKCLEYLVGEGRSVGEGRGGNGGVEVREWGSVGEGRGREGKCREEEERGCSLHSFRD